MDQNKKLLAIGEALIDFIPDRTGCAFEEVTAFSPKLGGAPVNVLGAFSALGGKAGLLTALGEDGFGRRILGELAAAGIDTAGVRLTDRANTALAFVSLDESGERSFSFYRSPSADMLFSADDLDPACFGGSFALHFCSVSLGDFPMKEAHRRAIALAREAGALVSFDPNLRFPLWKERSALFRAVWEFLPKAHILKLSEEELPFLLGGKSGLAEQEAARALLIGEVTLLLLTRGGAGASAYLRRKDGSLLSLSAPGCPAKTVDTTGAGDGFVGSFLFFLAQSGVTPQSLAALSEKKLAEVLFFANRFAAASTACYGAFAAYREAARLVLGQADDAGEGAEHEAEKKAENEAEKKDGEEPGRMCGGRTEGAKSEARSS